MTAIYNTFHNATEFAQGIFDLIGTFLSFIISFITNIGSYFNTVIEFLKVYVVELPITFVSMFGELPYFVQTGLIVLLYAMYLAFAFRILKLIVPFLQEVGLMDNFALHIHEMVVSIIGTLPAHLEFIYGLTDCVIVIIIVLFAFSPWILLFRLLDRQVFL